MMEGLSSLRVRIGLAVCGLLVLTKFGLVPLVAWQRNTLQNIAMLQRVVVKKSSLIGNEKKIEALLTTSKKQYDNALKYFFQKFTDSQALQLILQKRIESLSAKAGIKVTSTDWLYPTEGPLVQAPIKIRAEGTPEKILRFIYLIESDAHFLSIDNLSIFSSGRLPIVSAELDVSAYGFKTP